MARVAIVGFESTARPDWQSFVAEPVAPSNYKDPVKIEEYVERSKVKQQQECALVPMTGRLKITAILGFEVSSDPQKASVHFETVEVSDKGDPLDSLLKYESVVGLDVSKFLSLAVVNSIDKNKVLRTNHYWAKPAIGLDYRKIVVDPLHVLIGAYTGEELILASRRFGIEVPARACAMNAAKLGESFARLIGLI